MIPVSDSDFDSVSGETQANIPSLTEWNEYSVELCIALCSFLLPHEDIRFHDGDVSPVKSQGQSSQTVSLAYWELAVRWIIKVLLTVFPLIKACVNDSGLPNHIRFELLFFRLQILIQLKIIAAESRNNFFQYRHT